MPTRRGSVAFRLAPFLLVLAALGPLAADEDRPADLLEGVAWLDAKGFTPPGSRPFVRVLAGSWTDDAGEVRPNAPVHGLLVEDEGERFEVLTTTLQTLEFEPTPPGTPAAQRVGWEEADLGAYVDSVVAAWAPASDGYDNAGPWRIWQTRMDRRGEALVLAWIAWKQGLEEDAVRVWEAARASDPSQPLLPAARADVELAVWWRIVDAFGDPEVPWTRLLADVTNYVRRFPESGFAESARRTRATLVRTASGASTPEPAADAPVDERARWLVDQLVTQNGMQPGQPGRCDVFLDPRGEESPAHRLLALGFDAVPTLIEALDDQRFTRSIGYVRDFYFSHHVLRVSDVALDVLQAIAGRGFWQAPYFSEHLSQEDDPEARARVRGEIEAWWTDAAAKGEAAMLAEAVAAGDARAAYLATRLVERYPERALEALEAGIAAASSPEDRGYLVSAVSRLERPEATEVLRGVLRGDPSRLVRVTAAIQLLPSQPEEAIAAMAAEWEGTPGVEGTWWSDDAEDLLLGFLVGCGDARGIQAVSARMDACGVPWRVNAISHLVHGAWNTRMPYVLPPPAPDREVRRAPEPVLRAAKALLLARLGDRAPAPLPPGMSSSFHDRFVLPVVADYAAWALAEVFPDRYLAFDPAAPLDERDAWIARALAAAGRETLPPRFDVPPGAEEDADRPRRVTEALLGGDVDDLEGGFADTVAALDQQVLTPKAWMGLLLDAVAAVAPGGRHVTLRLERPAPAAGLRITVTVRAEATGDEGSLGYGWSYQVGPRNVAGGGGSGDLAYKREEEAWSDHLEAIQELLAAPPDEILVAEVRMVRQ